MFLFIFSSLFLFYGQSVNFVSIGNIRVWRACAYENCHGVRVFRGDSHGFFLDRGNGTRLEIQSRDIPSKVYEHRRLTKTGRLLHRTVAD